MAYQIEGGKKNPLELISYSKNNVRLFFEKNYRLRKFQSNITIISLSKYGIFYLKYYKYGTQ